MIFHDAIQLALAGCKLSWAAQVFKCFSALGEPLPLVADAPIAIDNSLLQEVFLQDRLASFDMSSTACLRIPDSPCRLGSSFAHITAGLGAPKMQLAHIIGIHQWEMLIAPDSQIFCMGSHHHPIEEGRHVIQPRASCVCNLCNTGALDYERHMLFECPALTGLKLHFSSLLLSCFSAMRRLLWAKDQHEVCRYIIACLDRMSSH